MLGLGPKAAGLSIEAAGIRYISFKNDKTWEIRKKRFLPLLPGMIIENQIADSEALYERVKQWVKAEGLRGTTVSLTVPTSQIIIRTMTIPNTNDKQVEQLVKLEVETGLHLPFENPVYDYVTTAVDEEQSHLLVFAAPRKSIQDYVDVLERAGLRVRGVEISATALARSIGAEHGESFTETMLINMEQSVMDIYMFRSGNPVFIRTINLFDLHQGPNAVAMGGSIEGDDAEVEIAAAAEQHLSPEQMVEVIAEISRMLNFYQYSLHDGSTRIHNVLITGVPQIREQLHDELLQSLADLEIRPIGLEQIAAALPDSELNDYRVAAGAALRKRNQRDTINLLPREDRETLLFPYVAVVLVGIWLLGMIVTGIYYVSNKGQIADGKETIQGLNDRSAILQLELGKLTSSGAGQLDRKAAIKEILKYKLSAVALVNELVSGLPPGAVIRDVTYSYQKSIDLNVNVLRMEDASSYLVELGKMSFTNNASILKLTEESADQRFGDSDETSALKKYLAVYKITIGTGQQENSEKGGDGDGTVQ